VHRSISVHMANLRQFVQVGQHFEGVTLIHQELLALGTVVHLLRVAADQRVKVRTELLLLQPSSTKTWQHQACCTSTPTPGCFTDGHIPAAGYLCRCILCCCPAWQTASLASTEWPS